MATVTGFKCLDETGMPILCDAYGNNAALRCLGCGSPILITFLKNQKGSDPVHPSKCITCGLKFWVEVNEDQNQLVLHQIK